MMYQNKRLTPVSVIIFPLLLLTGLVVSAIFFPINAARADELPLVAVVATGGTIAEKIDPETGAAVPALSGDDLVKSVPGLEDVAGVAVKEFANIDSCQMTPEIMLDLAWTVKELLEKDEITGVVVVHGTDTMEETAYFLDLTLDSPKPVVLVGAQRNASDPSTDGPGNLLNAVLEAASPEARGLGVTVNMNQYICAARDVRKTHTDNVMTFASLDSGFLGYVDFGQVRVYRKPAGRIHIPLPHKHLHFPEVMLFTMYSGADGKYIRYGVENGVKGIVIAGFGLGNVNQSVFEAVNYARSKGVPVVISSKCYDGRTYPLYGGDGGGKTLLDSGVIFSGDLIPSKARILLLLALTQTADSGKIAEYFK